MDTIVTIDFDIIMEPSIELYNNMLGEACEDATDVLLQYPFIGGLPANLELYKLLTLYISQIDREKIIFIDNHDELVDDIEEKVNIINIDHHHDVAYEDEDFSRRLKRHHEGNWVKYLYDNKLLNTYTWLKDYESLDLSKEYQKKYINELHFFEDYHMEDLIKQTDKLYICASFEWVPSEYHYLYELWQEMFSNHKEEEEE